MSAWKSNSCGGNHVSRQVDANTGYRGHTLISLIKSVVKVQTCLDAQNFWTVLFLEYLKIISDSHSPGYLIKQPTTIRYVVEDQVDPPVTHHQTSSLRKSPWFGGLTSPCLSRNSCVQPRTQNHQAITSPNKESASRPLGRFHHPNWRQRSSITCKPQPSTRSRPFQCIKYVVCFSVGAFSSQDWFPRPR